MSTTTIKQGVQYEITADDKASRVAQDAAASVAKAADASAQSSAKAGDAAAKAGDAAASGAKKGVNGFNAMSAASSALRGDFTSMGRELGKLFTDSAKSAGALAANIGVVGTAISSVVQFGSALKNLIDKSLNLGQGWIGSVSSNIARLKSQFLEYTEAFKEANREAALHNSHLLNLIDAEARLAKAQREYSRQKDLADAATDEERAEINRRYDRDAASRDESARDEKLEARRIALEDEENRINDEIYASRQRQRKAHKAGIEATSLGYFDQATEAQSQFAREDELQETLEARLKDIRRAQDILFLEERAQHTEDAARHQKDRNDDEALLAAQFEQRFAAQLGILKAYYGDQWRYASDLNDGAAAVRDLAIRREQDKIDADYLELDTLEQNTSYLKSIYQLLAQD